MISKFKDKNKMCSVQNELQHLIGAFKRCDKSAFKTESLKELKEMKKEVDKQVKKEWKEFVGKDRVLVPCSSCQGDGYKLKYVGLGCGDSMDASPYGRNRCKNCDGDGMILIRKISV